MVRVRFAPSPTGNLHIGGLRTAFFNWLFAKHHGGKFLLRIEDTDVERSTATYQQAIIDAFAWVRIAADEPIVIQSQRLAEHQCLAKQLLAAGKAYKCFCTPAELDARLAQHHGIVNESDRKYDGYCRTAAAVATQEQANKPYAIRFAMPDGDAELVVEDIIRGTVTFPREQFDDFVIVRSDGTPMYNFVVVADDHAMAITHVIRGEEHLINTPKQMLLYQAFGWQVPYFAHLPLILAPSGAKLSKRDAATSVIDYQQQGYLPDALLNYLVRLGWSHGDQEIFSREELIRYFTLDTIGKKGSIFDSAKLNWLNNQYMQQIGAHELMTAIQDNVWPDWLAHMPAFSREQVVELVSLYKERVATLRQLAAVIAAVAEVPRAYDMVAMAPYLTPTLLPSLQVLMQELQAIAVWDLATVTATIKRVAQSQGVALPMIAHPLRCALVGTVTSPSIFALVTTISRPIVLSRIARFIEYLESTVEHAALKGGSA
ncbi:glutamate--tRNA ligase [Candidatus Dependentiae bacterium]|nr:glutamate--tRNA ligase [Candidatus Dependentiae bacterium]